MIRLLEREQLEKLVKVKKLSAFKFNGFGNVWIQRDKDRLEKL